jgi:hypothetical protein
LVGGQNEEGFEQGVSFVDKGQSDIDKGCAASHRRGASAGRPEKSI